MCVPGTLAGGRRRDWSLRDKLQNPAHTFCKRDWWDAAHETWAASYATVSHTQARTHTNRHDGTHHPLLRSKILVLIKPHELIFQRGQLGKANSPSPILLLKSYWSPRLYVKMDTYESGQNTNKLASLPPSLYSRCAAADCCWPLFAKDQSLLVSMGSCTN